VAQHFAPFGLGLARFSFNAPLENDLRIAPDRVSLQFGTDIALRYGMDDISEIAFRPRADRRVSVCPHCRMRGRAVDVRVESGRATICYHCSSCSCDWTAQRTLSAAPISARLTDPEQRLPRS